MYVYTCVNKILYAQIVSCFKFRRWLIFFFVFFPGLSVFIQHPVLILHLEQPTGATSLNHWAFFFFFVQAKQSLSQAKSVLDTGETFGNCTQEVTGVFFLVPWRLAAEVQWGARTVNAAVAVEEEGELIKKHSMSSCKWRQRKEKRHFWMQLVVDVRCRILFLQTSRAFLSYRSQHWKANINFNIL